VVVGGWGGGAEAEEEAVMAPSVETEEGRRPSADPSAETEGGVGLRLSRELGLRVGAQGVGASREVAGGGTKPGIRGRPTHRPRRSAINVDPVDGR
jgi:hypothetical protein